ncbi:MAG: exodeoxyribonuclease III [Rickettsiaceae bacterium]|nr:exodeoxyribonuclease III [Rickettsiaceae bacterium]
MKIITWNINSIRLRLDLLEKISLKHQADVICLQETKVLDELFPIERIKKMGFEYVVFAGEKSYNGVAILSKFPITHSFALNLYDDKKRHISAVIKGIEVHNFYIPAGGDIADPELNPKFKYKLDYNILARKWLEQNRKKTDKIILLGDLNTAPYEHDVWSTKQLTNVVSHTPIERELLIALCKSLDFIDTGRYFVSLDQKLYSWWSYRNQDWKKSNRGRRLDHIWVTTPLKHALISTHYDKEIRDEISTSDHIPCMVELDI